MMLLVVIVCCVRVAFQLQYHQPQRFYVRPPLRYYSPAVQPLFFPNYGYTDQYLQLLDSSEVRAHSNLPIFSIYNFMYLVSCKSNYVGWRHPDKLQNLKSESEWSDTEGRVPGGGKGKEKSQARFFGIAHLHSSLLSLNVNPLLTVTSTLLFTVASTATIVSVKSCINAGYKKLFY